MTPLGCALHLLRICVCLHGLYTHTAPDHVACLVDSWCRRSFGADTSTAINPVVCLSVSTCQSPGLVQSHDGGGCRTTSRGGRASATAAAAAARELHRGGEVVFRGISLAGVRGSDARRGESRNRIALAARGKVNIMCDADALAKVSVGSAVTFDRTDFLTFGGFDNTPVCALVACAGNDPKRIGTLINEGDRRHRLNSATVLLR